MFLLSLSVAKDFGGQGCFCFSWYTEKDVDALSMLRYQRSTIVLCAFFIFALASAFFFWLQAKPVFPDPDSFYHITMAQLLGEQGVVQHFPWLAFTGLPSYYTDQHFLYHVVLLPFVTLLHPVVGAKVATVFINAALLSLIAVFLIRFRVRFWPVFCTILLVTNPFLFRINLVKAPGLSIVLLVTGLWLLFRERPWPLAALAFLYVWTYGGFAMLGIFAAVYAVATVLHTQQNQHGVLQVFRRFLPQRWLWANLLRHPALRCLSAVVAGLTLGVVLSPYFPQNLFFYWQQLVQIGIVNFQNVVNVGGEWRPYGFIELLANTVFVSIAVLLAYVGFFITYRKQTNQSWTLALLTVLFFLITLKSRRYVELYVPFAVLFAAFVSRDALPNVRPATLWQWYRRVFRRHAVVTALLSGYVLVTSTSIVVRDTRQLDADLKSGFSATYLQNVSAWLAAHTPVGSIVVHSDWDEFPSLFYHNRRNYYIVGLDPTFMYQYNRLLYQRWADLTSGTRSEDAARIITRDLQSATVVVTSDHPDFARTMREQRSFVKVYEDAEAAVYQLRAGMP